MNDLTNNLTAEQLTMLTMKYAELLKEVNPSYDKTKCAWIIDTCFDHLNKGHHELPKVNKAWAVTVVMRRYDEINLADTMDKAIETITAIIDSYVAFNNQYYAQYCENISLWNNDYAKDNQFINNFCLFN